MFRKTLIALAATATIGMAALTPTVASAHYYGEYSGYGARHYGGYHYRHHGYAFYPSYGYGYGYRHNYHHRRYW